MRSLLVSLASRQHEVGRDAMKGYLRGRFAEKDPEWIRYCCSHAKGPKWAKLGEAQGLSKVG